MNYIFHRFTSFEDILKWSSFLLEGWNSITAFTHDDGLPWVDFLTKLVGFIERPESEAAICVVCSKNNKPLGFFVIANDSEGRKRVALLYALYSNSKDTNLLHVMSEWIIPWCKANSYVELFAITARLNGAAKRLFQRKGHFKPVGMIYKRSIE